MKIRLPGLAWAIALLALPATAATYQGHGCDDRWYDGKAVSTTYGAYECQIRFNGDRVYLKIPGSGLQIVGILDEEVISDPHEIVAQDPKRGVAWTIDCYNLR